MTRAVVLFTSDLRLHGHPPPRAALAAADEVVPLFVRDPGAHAAGFDASLRRRRGFPSARGPGTTVGVEEEGRLPSGRRPVQAVLQASLPCGRHASSGSSAPASPISVRTSPVYGSVS